MSIASGPMEKVEADSIIASMKPVISSAVSPLAVRAVRKLAIRTRFDLTLEDLHERLARLAAFEVGAAHERIEDVERE